MCTLRTSHRWYNWQHVVRQQLYTPSMHRQKWLQCDVPVVRQEVVRQWDLDRFPRYDDTRLGVYTGCISPNPISLRTR